MSAFGSTIEILLTKNMLQLWQSSVYFDTLKISNCDFQYMANQSLKCKLPITNQKKENKSEINSKFHNVYTLNTLYHLILPYISRLGPKGSRFVFS